MDNKKVDGVKKLSQDEIKKSRKIVLDTIGEGVKPPSTPKISLARPKLDAVQQSEAPQKRDIKPVPLPEIKREQLKPGPKQVLSAQEVVKRRKWREEVERILPPEQAGAKNEAELRKKIKKPIADPVVRTPDFVDAIKKHYPETGLEVDKKLQKSPVKDSLAQEKAAARLQKEQQLARKEKDREGKKKRKQEKKRLLKEAEKKRERQKARQTEEQTKAREQLSRAKAERCKRRRQKRAEFVIRFKKSRSGYVKKTKAAFFRVFLTIIIFSAALTMLYILIIITVVETGVDNALFRIIGKRLPIPAYITNRGLVEYYTYLDIRKALSPDYYNNEELEKAVKISIIEQAIINELLAKHSLLKHEYNDYDEIMAALAERIVFDYEITKLIL